MDDSLQNVRRIVEHRIRKLDEVDNLGVEQLARLDTLIECKEIIDDVTNKKKQEDEGIDCLFG